MRISELTGGEASLHSDKIEVNDKGSRIKKIILKPLGFSFPLIGIIFFTLFWNGFLVIWTALAIQDSLFAALFSIPFWIIGFLLIMGVGVSMFGKQYIILGRSQLVIQKIVLYRIAQLSIQYKDILSIENIRQLGAVKTGKLLASSAPDSGIITKTPTITYSKDGKRKELMFAEHMDKNDQTWLVDFLNEEIAPYLKNAL